MALKIISIFALLLSLSGNILINYRYRSGFIVWTLSNVLWIAVNVMSVPNIPQMAMFIVYIAFNVHGWMNWRKQ